MLTEVETTVLDPQRERATCLIGTKVERPVPDLPRAPDELAVPRFARRSVRLVAHRVRGRSSDTGAVTDRNVLGAPLEPCGVDPMTGFYRDGCCSTGPQDIGSHTVCAVVTAEFLAHQRDIGNDLSTPIPQYHFPGLVPGDRWCVTARNWLRAHYDGAAAPVVLASTHERALDIITIEILRQHAVDVPSDLRDLEA